MDFKALLPRRLSSRRSRFVILLLAFSAWMLAVKWILESQLSDNPTAPFSSTNHSVHASTPKTPHNEYSKNTWKERDSENARFLLEEAVRKVLKERDEKEEEMRRIADEEAKKVAQKEGHPKTTLTLEELEVDVDFVQAQFLDYLNGEEGKTDPDSVFGGLLLNLNEPFDFRGGWNRIHQHAKYLVKSVEYKRSDFLQLGRRVRANLIIYTLLHDKQSLLPILAHTTTTTTSTDNSMSSFRKELETIVSDLTKIIYPWLSPTYPSIHAMQTKYLEKNEEGIVFCSGQWHFEMAVHAITTFRDVLGCTLPIEVHYAGPGDLTPKMLKALNSMQNVTTDPRVLLEGSNIFKEYGSMFYHDRSLFRDDPANWFKGINPVWSRYAGSKLRYMKLLSHHEQESGVVVVDKGRTGPLHAMLMVCVLNSRLERDDVTYKNMHGDKETYWISWDMARVPYKFTPSYGGTVGYKNEKNRICGGLFHTDEFFDPLWWNGGVIANKHASRDTEFMKFEYAAYDTDGDKVVWDWETPTTPFCLGPRTPEKEVLELTLTQKNMGARFVDLYKEIKLGGWEEYFRKKYSVQFE
ncbi:UNVERIFIED_CONTAM: hypothetical protein HDU68_009715 [Siphonaria sp. JEL0065]|nr:hypothetical protein HDU68_009715 [Siphonaria sp. JEL0065]